MSDTEPSIIEGHAEIALTAQQLVSGTRHELCWISFKLERKLYGAEDFADAIKHLLLGDHRNRVRVLVNRAQDAASGGGRRIVELAQAMPSRMEIRQLSEQHLHDWRCERLLADGRRLLERHNPDSFSGRHWPDAPFTGARMLKEFDELWDTAEPTAEFRRLSL